MAAQATPRTSLAAHVSVYARCSSCDRETKLDVPALIEAGYGGRSLRNLPLRCSNCGATTYRLTVTPH
ncbi:MAG: hypothetical protein JO110_02210 [Acetobacteraceae bacterium]|nr:hypothetical protein [Acetobacteraceae bacterium]